MIIFDIVIPIIWAGGLLSLGQIAVSGEGSRFKFENIFPLTAFMGTIIFAIGLLGWINHQLFYIITLLLLILFAFKFKVLLSHLKEFIKNHLFVFIIMVLISVWLSLAALSYPVGPDALYFHLGLPKIYARAGGVTFIPGNIFSASPRAMEMMSTAFLSMGLERGAQFFILLLAIALIISVWRKADEIGGSGIIAALILVSASIFSTQLVDSKNDILLTGVIFFAVVQFFAFRQSDSIKSLIFAGIGAGLAAGVKATGLSIIGVLGLILLYDFITGRTKFKQFALFLSISIVVASPWYAYSWFVTGNPLYPFFGNYFHSPYWYQIFDAFNRAISAKTADTNILNLIVSPFNLVFDPEAFRGRIGYAVILLPLLLLFMKKIPTAIRWISCLSLIYYLFWYFGFPLARYLMPILPLLAIAGSYFAKAAIDERGVIKYTIIMALIFAVLIPIPTVLSQTSYRVISVIKNMGRDSFLEQYKTFDPNSPRSGEMANQFEYFKCWRAIESNTSPDGKIGILSSFWTRADGYYLNRNFVYLNPSEQNAYDFTTIRDSSEVSHALSNLGISIVVVDSLVLAEFSSKSPWKDSPGFPIFSLGVGALNRYLKTSAELIYSNDRFSVYKIKILPPKY